MLPCYHGNHSEQGDRRRIETGGGTEWRSARKRGEEVAGGEGRKSTKDLIPHQLLDWFSFLSTPDLLSITMTTAQLEEEVTIRFPSCRDVNIQQQLCSTGRLI